MTTNPKTKATGLLARRLAELEERADLFGLVVEMEKRATSTRFRLLTKIEGTAGEEVMPWLSWANCDRFLQGAEYGIHIFCGSGAIIAKKDPMTTLLAGPLPELRIAQKEARLACWHRNDMRAERDRLASMLRSTQQEREDAKNQLRNDRALRDQFQRDMDTLTETDRKALTALRMEVLNLRRELEDTNRALEEANQTLEDL